MENAEFIFLGIKIADWLEIGAFVLAIFGLYYNTKEQKKTNFQERIQIISNTVNEIYQDKELSEILYRLISSNSNKPFVYTKEFHNSKDEMSLDKLLFKLDFLAKQYYANILTLEDFLIIKEIYLDIYTNEEVDKYFHYLDEYYKSVNKKNEFALSFRNLAKEFIKLK